MRELIYLRIEQKMENELELIKKESWGSYGDNTSMSRGEFYARLQIIYGHLEDYENRLEHLETTVYAPRNFLFSLFSTTIGRLILIGITLLVAWAFGVFGLNPLKGLFY